MLLRVINYFILTLIFIGCSIGVRNPAPLYQYSIYVDYCALHKKECQLLQDLNFSAPKKDVKCMVQADNTTKVICPYQKHNILKISAEIKACVNCDATLLNETNATLLNETNATLLNETNATLLNETNATLLNELSGIIRFYDYCIKLPDECQTLGNIKIKYKNKLKVCKKVKTTNDLVVRCSKE